MAKKQARSAWHAEDRETGHGLTRPAGSDDAPRDAEAAARDAEALAQPAIVTVRWRAEGGYGADLAQ